MSGCGGDDAFMTAGWEGRCEKDHYSQWRLKFYNMNWRIFLLRHRTFSSWVCRNNPEILHVRCQELFTTVFVAKTQFLMRSFQLILCQHDLFLTLSNCFLCLPDHKHSVENQPWRNVKLQDKDKWCFNLFVFKETCITNIIPLTR